MICTRKSLYRRLKQIKNQFNWYMVGSQIRASRRNKFTTMHFCPITALRYAKDGKYYGISTPHAACKNELGEILISNVVSSADNIAINKERTLIRKWMQKNLFGQ